MPSFLIHIYISIVVTFIIFIPGGGTTPGGGGGGITTAGGGGGGGGKRTATWSFLFLKSWNSGALVELEESSVLEVSPVVVAKASAVVTPAAAVEEPVVTPP